MLKMRLPMRTAEEGGNETAEDKQDHADPGLHSPGSVDQSATGVTENSPRRLGCPLRLNKEAVFEWFGLHLNPAKRIEFMCGLLHMCQPLELRFLGSCLEDLARKDFHVLRDFEMKANSPSELGLLTDVADPVVRSRLLVCLSLLGSENRECAGILFRILSHADPALYFRNHGFPASSYRDPRHPRLHPSCEDADEPGKSERLAGPLSEEGAGLLEQFALLFTMASLHPAFPFHQRETVRVQLEKVELAMREEQLRRRGADSPNKIPQTGDFSPSTDSIPNNRVQCRHSAQPTAKKSQREAVYIEKILLKGISWSRTDKEYSFEVKWSDSSSSSVIKTHHDLEEFLLKLPKEFATECFEKSIVRLLSQGDKYESRELERTLKEKFLSAPPAFRQTGTVCGFFLSDSSGSSCSRCSPKALGKPFAEDCSEASSQEEDLEQYVVGHRKKPGTKSPSLSSQSSKSCPADGRRATPSELNSAPDWRRKSYPMNPALEQRGPGPEQQHQGDQKWSSTPSTKSKPRAAATDREKGKVGEGRLAYVGNGIMRPAPVHLGRQPARKDGRQDVGSGQDSYGETSSESYSSPSSPQHDGQESLESEDEKDKDTDSHSDDCGKDRVEPFPSPKQLAGAALATMRPLLPIPLKEEPSCTEGPLSSPVFPQLSFVHTLPYVVQNGAVPSPEPGSVAHGPDSKPIVGVAGVGATPLGLREAVSGTVPSGEGEKLPPEPAYLPNAFGPSLAGLPQAAGPAVQPLVQRFKAAALQGSSENCTLPHQPPVGSVGVLPQGTSYMSPLTQAYPSTEPALGSSLPNPIPLTEPHAKPPSLSLSAGLATSYSLPVPTSVMPSVGGVATPTVSQVQVMVPPAIPTHTPGPAPSSSPALTHSTAQSDSTSYINSTSCGTSSGASQPQQQQSTPPQQMGCRTCGCRGSCGSNHAPNYFFPPQMPRQVLSMPHIFHLTSLPHQSNGTTQLPFFPPAPYASGPLLHTHSEHVLSTQVGYGMQQMAAFNRFYQPVFPPVSMMPSSALTAGIKKNSSNVSCYNCGVSGHYAQDCKQPSIDATQQGGFRLKYVGAQSSEMIDKAD